MRMGIEVEFTGISTRRAAELVADYFDSDVEECINFVDNAARDSYKVEDYSGSEWCVIEDRSINSDNCEFNHCCELVTPVLDGFEGLYNLYDLLEIIRSEGGYVNDTCGVHIHIDKPTSSKLFHMMREFFNIQDEVVRKFNIPRYRVEKYCKLYPKWFIDSFLSEFDNYRSLDDMLNFCYRMLGNDSVEKNSLRYYLLNVDSIRKIGTVEFRMFNSTLDKKELQEYISWVENFIKGL